jgi:hypothetical protein
MAPSLNTVITCRSVFDPGTVDPWQSLHNDQGIALQWKLAKENGGARSCGLCGTSYFSRAVQKKKVIHRRNQKRKMLKKQTRPRAGSPKPR